MEENQFIPDEEQMQLVRLVIEGKTKGEIANSIKLCTEHAVKKRISALYRKAGVKDRFGLLRKALTERWGEPPPAPIDMSLCKNSGSCPIVKHLLEKKNLQNK